MSLRNGFTFGDWTVYPLEGRLVGEGAEQRIPPKSMDVLLYMAAHAGAVVERDSLLRSVWGERAQSDEPLTRCIGELRRAFGDTREEPEYILTIPKRGYQLLKPVSLLEPDEAPSDEARAGNSKPRLTEQQREQRLGMLKKIAIGAVVLIAAALTEIFLERIIDEPGATAGDSDSGSARTTTVSADQRSVAVLPFMVFSSGEDDGYFADGLTEEILNALTQLPELRVTARTSSFFFKGKNLPVPEIAAHLNVAHIVEGSVRRDGERLRVTAQLIRVSDDSHLWSSAYDRTLGDVFAVQKDIAENIAEVLGVVMDDDARDAMEKVGIRDVDAFIAYQKGLNEWVTAHEQFPFIAEALPAAEPWLDRVLDAAPGLTSARMMKADRNIHVLLEVASGIRDQYFAGESQDALVALLSEYDMAIQLSPAGIQRNIMELERTLFGDDWTNVASQIQRALQPGGCPRMDWMKVFISHFGYAEQLIEKTAETLACNPMDIAANYNFPWLYIMAGDPEGAFRVIGESDNRGIRHPWLEDARFLARLAAGELDDIATIGAGSPGSTLLYGRRILFEALAGDVAVARQMAEEFWSSPEADDASAMQLAAIVGDRQRANEIAARIDKLPGGTIVFSEAILTCFCGAPFDLEAAPNYQKRVNEAGFDWPPPAPIKYPAKTW